MRWGHAAFAAGLSIAWSSGAIASDLVYTPVNPSFGGNPFNSSHLLGIANAQNKFKDPESSTRGSQADIFARQLQSRLLSALSSQIVEAIFGENAQQAGTIEFGGQIISWVRELEQVTLTITNSDTGEVTTIQIPTIIAIGG